MTRPSMPVIDPDPSGYCHPIQTRQVQNQNQNSPSISKWKARGVNYLYNMTVCACYMGPFFHEVKFTKVGPKLELQKWRAPNLQQLMHTDCSNSTPDTTNTVFTINILKTCNRGFVL